MHSARPQDLATKHVADTTHHTLVQQHFRDRCLRIVVVRHTCGALVQVGITPTQIWATTPGAGMSVVIELAVRLHYWRTETHGDPVFRRNDHTSMM